MRLASVLPLALVSLVGALGCGGGGAPATTPPPSSGTTSEGGAETFAEVNPADLAELDAGPSKPAATPETAGTPPPSDAPPDPCTPVGVDFEKRARPKMKECYAEAKKKEPNLQGTVKIRVDIDIRGKIKATKILEKTLPEPVAQCMLKVVKATPLPEALKCAGLSLTIPMTFPTPK